MPKVVLFLLLLLVCRCSVLWGQTPNLPATRTCGTTQVQQKQIEQNPAIAQRLERVKTKAASFMLGMSRTRYNQPIIQIPVVFHIVYHRSEENISDEQIQSQLEVLNQDYRRWNTDTANTLTAFKKVAADAGIQFCLATIDPLGQPTSGITRTYTNSVGFSTDEAVKYTAQGGKDAWDPSKYLNIWVCNLENGYLGYGQFPDGPPEIDGVVLLYQVVGSYPANPYLFAFNQGRTATHEVGHWLGLEHIWGQKEFDCTDSDGIADTPNQDKANQGCPTGTVTSCDNAQQGGDMYQNFMDYTDDSCMNLFTLDQAAYMQAVVNTSRAGLLSAVVCEFPLRADFNASDSIITVGSTIQFSDNSIGIRATSWQWTFEGGSPATSTVQNPEVLYDKPGRYAVTLTVRNGALGSTKTKTAYIFVTAGEPRIYPNPTPRFTTLELPADYEVQTVLLLNALGQTVRTGMPENSLIKFDLAGLANGIYYTKIVLKNGRVVTKKVLVLRE